MLSSFKQLTANMKSLLDMQLGVGIKTVEDWILNLGAEVYKAQYDQGYIARFVLPASLLLFRRSDL